MKPKFTILSYSIFLLLLLYPLFSHAAKAHVPSKVGENSSLLAFFFRRFIGTHKGNKVNNLHIIKNYFSEFGYLNNKYSTYNINQANPENDLFDSRLETAVKKYQKFFKLHVNGVLDLKTITQMSHPRCGVRDIMSDSEKFNHNKTIGTQYYAFMLFKPKWKTTYLTYSFGPGTSEKAKAELRRALFSWANVTKFTFSETYFKKANIKMSFEKGFHWDLFPFDGPNGVLAHTNPPPGGTVHFDASEEWSSESSSRNAYDLGTVGLHELGHALGLAHTNVKDAIMFPIILPGQKKGLGKDDIDGIKALYHF